MNDKINSGLICTISLVNDNYFIWGNELRKILTFNHNYQIDPCNKYFVDFYCGF